jgi:hypothetical protein
MDSCIISVLCCDLVTVSITICMVIDVSGSFFVLSVLFFMGPKGPSEARLLFSGSAGCLLVSCCWFVFACVLLLLGSC